MRNFFFATFLLRSPQHRGSFSRGLFCVSLVRNLPSAAKRPLGPWFSLNVELHHRQKKPKGLFPLLKSHGLYLGRKSCWQRSRQQAARRWRDRCRPLPAGRLAEAGAGQQSPPPRPHLGSPGRTWGFPAARGLTRRVLPAPGPPSRAWPRRRLRSKWRWRRRAAGYETRGRHMAAPAPNLTGPVASRRPARPGRLRRPRGSRHSPTDR